MCVHDLRTKSRVPPLAIRRASANGGNFDRSSFAAIICAIQSLKHAIPNFDALLEPLHLILEGLYKRN